MRPTEQRKEKTAKNKRGIHKGDFQKNCQALTTITEETIFVMGFGGNSEFPR